MKQIDLIIKHAYLITMNEKREIIPRRLHRGAGR